MRRPVLLRRAALTALAACAAFAPLPAIAVADSGPSAGDNQYVDPLSGTQSSTHSSSASHPTTTSSGSSSSGTAPSTSAYTPSAASAPAAAATTATAPPASSSTAGDPRGALPFTGLDTELIALVGAGLAGGGLLLRLRVARR